MNEYTRMFWLHDNGLNLWSRTILPCKLQSNTREQWRERSSMRCCFRLEIAAEKGGLLAKHFGKALFIFLVTRNKYSCLQNCVKWTFVFLSCPEFGILPIFLSGIFLFWKIPAKIPRNRPFSPRICLCKSCEISLFSPPWYTIIWTDTDSKDETLKKGTAAQTWLPICRNMIFSQRQTYQFANWQTKALQLWATENQ